MGPTNVCCRQSKKELQEEAKDLEKIRGTRKKVTKIHSGKLNKGNLFGDWDDQDNESEIKKVQSAR